MRLSEKYFYKSKYFLFSCLSFIIGIGIFSFWPFCSGEKCEVFLFGAAILTVIPLVFFWKNKMARLILFLIIFLFLGFWRYAISVNQNSFDIISFYNGQNVVFKGIVNNFPDSRDKTLRLEISANKITNADNLEINKNVNGKVLVVLNKYPSYNYGDQLRIKCQLDEPAAFNNFDYGRYLSKFDIYSVCDWPQASLISKNDGNKILAFTYKIKEKISAIINKGLPEPEASLAQAMILNITNIPSNLRDVFSQAGISHIIAISGDHISLLSAIIMVFLIGIGLRRQYAFYFATAFLIFYVLLIGAPASAVRAAIMGFLLLLALNIGRINNVINSLIFAAAIMLLLNPKLLRDDVGFQLSFLSVLGIACFYPLFYKITQKYKIPKLKGFLDIFLITISAQVLIIPIVAQNFQIISIISPITNLLILWAIPFLMVFLLGAIILSVLFSFLAVLFFFPSYLILKYMIFVSGTIIKIPGSYGIINNIWIGWIILYYFVVTVIFYFLKKKFN